VDNKERTLVTTLTKKSSEHLTEYLQSLNFRVRYLHSGVETMERSQLLKDLRLGVFDILIGINLLREGLDLPEVSLVAILDADKEGFLRSEKSLMQVAGRTARNVNGLVIMYADVITKSMQKTISETNRRRKLQSAYNEEHNITPQTVIKTKEEILSQGSILDVRGKKSTAYIESEEPSLAADPIVSYLNRDQIEKMVHETEERMKKAAKDLDFITAAQYRDELFALKKRLKEVF